LIPIKRTPEVIPEPSTFEKISLFLDRYGGTLLLSIFAFVALFLIHGIIKKTLVKVRHIPAEELKKVEEEPIITEAPPEKELFRIREAIKSMVNRNPRAVAGIIRKWTFEK
jgi:flagellar biosynthesis/type III secretory pathway M-ring protein FliF/YscJ